VVVGDDDGVDGRQVCEDQRRGEETLWAGPLHRSGTLVPDRVDKDANSVDFDERGGVAHPGNSEAGAGAGGEDSRIRLERAGLRLGRAGCRSQEEAGADFEYDGQSAYVSRYRVQKLIPLPLGWSDWHVD